ncbi:hypothetical protein QKG53_14500 [Clavibacter michiganensis]|uniref:hypothetical protein n=1 Tax=Clavibacter michiganensis TaxID=28447 RepID=UPI0026DAB520|nr:hypothetical protein [Clavibacter michiganensis]MDO4058030.1 hypothetical protein [Clavibacter michiganensis]
MLALASLADAGAALGWAGLASGFLTAGLVDLFGLLEGRRRRQDADRRLEPIRTGIINHLQLQRADLIDSVTVLYPLEGDPALWIAQLRANDWPAMKNEPARVFPPRSKGTRVAEMRRRMSERQLHVETLSASGIMTEEVSAMSAIVQRGGWAASLEALELVPSDGMRGMTASAADMLEQLLAIDLP